MAVGCVGYLTAPPAGSTGTTAMVPLPTLRKKPVWAPPDGPPPSASGTTTTTDLRTCSALSTDKTNSIEIMATEPLPRSPSRPVCGTSKPDGEPVVASSTTTGTGTSIFLSRITCSSILSMCQNRELTSTAPGKVFPLIVAPVV